MTGQMHFFSVNKELDAELLKSELASDLNNVLRYADAKKLGVERLAEIQ